MLYHKYYKDVMNKKIIVIQQNILNPLLFFVFLPLLFLVEGQKFVDPNIQNTNIQTTESEAKTPQENEPSKGVEQKEVIYKYNKKVSSLMHPYWKKPFNYQKGDHCKIIINEDNLEILEIFCNTGAILSRSVQKSYEKSANEIEKSFFNGNYNIVFPDKGHDA